MNFHGEFSHPYIDKDMENAGLKQKVNELINDEMKNIEKERKCIEEVFETHTQSLEHGFPCQTEMQEYADLGREMVLLEELIKNQDRITQKEIEQQQAQLAEKKREKMFLVNETGKVLGERQSLQEAQVERLNRMQHKEKAIKKSIQHIQDAIRSTLS